MTLEEIDAIIAPAQESHDLVYEWISANGLASVTTLNPRGNTYLLNTTVDVAEKLLNAEYHMYSKDHL
jgi:tripeptidyl-peptidase-1